MLSFGFRIPLLNLRSSPRRIQLIAQKCVCNACCSLSHCLIPLLKNCIILLYKYVNLCTDLHFFLPCILYKNKVTGNVWWLTRWNCFLSLQNFDTSGLGMISSFLLGFHWPYHEEVGGVLLWIIRAFSYAKNIYWRW